VAGAVTAASGRSAGVAGPPAGVTAWVWPALAGAALAAVGGGAGLLRARTWPAPGRRFESPGATVPAGAPGTTGAGGRPEQVRGQGDAIGAWDALSRGEDPTR
jgi:hypothetical protein